VAVQRAETLHRADVPDLQSLVLGATHETEESRDGDLAKEMHEVINSGNRKKKHKQSQVTRKKERTRHVTALECPLRVMRHWLKLSRWVRAGAVGSSQMLIVPSQEPDAIRPRRAYDMTIFTTSSGKIDNESAKILRMVLV